MFFRHQRHSNPHPLATAVLGCVLGILLIAGARAEAVLAEPYRQPPYLPIQTYEQVQAGTDALSADYRSHLDQSRQRLGQAGYKPWTWMKSSCANCPLFILPLNVEIENEKVYAFIRALETKKAELLELYDGDAQEYNLLAQMAVGILGRESEFFQSPRYKIKENAQWAVNLLKVVQIYLEGSDRDPGINSRGPTQIKIVPEKIRETFGVEPHTLRIPENAALATMGYLMEALKELQRRVVLNDLDFVKPENYADYLPYIYFGSRRQLLNGTATPDKNIYIRDMRKYMKWVELYEGPPASQPLARP